MEAPAAVEAPAAQPNLYMGLGEQFALDGAALLGGGALPVGYASDRPDIAPVDAATGVITGLALGTANITVYANTGATAVWVVAVLNAPGALVLPANLTLGKGESAALTATTPEGTASAQVTYASSKPKVATVDAAGNVTAKRKGTVVITATAYNGASASCTVKICKAPSKLTLSSKMAVLSLGESRALAVKLPKNSASRLYWESDNSAVVGVDAAGALYGAGPGTANVTVHSFNNKRATCKVTVLGGAPPTTLALNAQAIQLGAKETFQLVPAVGAGEAAVYAYATGKKKVATVSASGLITAKKAGTAVITVTTHNGLTATVTVNVAKAPSKVTLSAGKLSLMAGQTAQLTAKLPAGTAASMIWESSNPAVATVDAGGFVTAVGAGEAAIRVTTFNGKSALCKLTVYSAGGDISIPDPAAQAEASNRSQMLANLNSSSVLGKKKEAIVGVMKLLMDAGFEPAFAAGVGANVFSEGTYGKFESSKYISNYKKRPRYFCYLDGGDYYTQVDGDYVLSAVYMSQEQLDAYTGEAEGRLRFGPENFYLDNYSGKYAYEIDLAQLEALMEALSAGGWQGKFGLGIVQWTGGRTQKLVAMYRKYAGASNTLTQAQIIAAENEMILSDFQGSYNAVYTAWKLANPGGLDTVEAARSAAALVCTRYEIPVNKEAKAVTRGDKAAAMFKVMLGN